MVVAEQDRLGAIRPRGAQQVDPHPVAIIDLGSEFVGLLDQPGRLVDQRHPDALRHQHLRHGLPEAPVTDHDHARLGRLVGPVEPLGAGLLARFEPIGQPHQERRRRHRQRHHRAEQRRRLGRDQLRRRRLREQHEPELARLAQQKPEPHAAWPAIPEQPRQPRQDQRLDRDHRQRHPDHQQRLGGDHAEVEQHPDRQEKQPEQDRTKRFDIAFKLMAIGRFGEHHPGNKRPQRHRQPQRVHQRRRPHNREQPRDDEQFALAQPPDQPEHRVDQPPPGQHQPDDRANGVQRQRPPPRRRRIGRHA